MKKLPKVRRDRVNQHDEMKHYLCWAIPIGLILFAALPFLFRLVLPILP